MAEKIRLLYNILHVSIVFISLVFGIIYWEKIKQNGYLKLFPIYIAVSLLISLFWFFEKLNFPGLLIQNIFILFEFLIFYNFFLKVLKGKKFHIILISLGALFFILVIIRATFLYTNQNKYLNLASFFNHYPFPELVVIEDILIVIPILLYNISLFNRPYINNISTDPIFLVMNGILFCMGISLPVFAFYNIIIEHNRQLYIYLYIINSVAYIGMHLLFIKAFKSIK